MTVRCNEGSIPFTPLLNTNLVADTLKVDPDVPFEGRVHEWEGVLILDTSRASINSFMACCSGVDREYRCPLGRVVHEEGVAQPFLG